MKKPDEILKHELGGMSIKYAPVLDPHIQRAMKEYAKQWVNHASDIAAFDCQDMLISQRIKELTKIIEKQ